MTALSKILLPQVLTRVISRQAASSDWLLNMFGCQPGGGSEFNEGHGRNGAYHIYDNVRKVAKGRAPGTAAARRAQNPMSRVPFNYPRMHDSVSLSAEVMHNLGQIANPAMRDEAGEQMIKRQTETLSQLAANWRKVMLAGMLRDDLYMIPDNDSYYFVFDSSGAADPNFQVAGQMPAGNKDQLDMLGAGDIINASWATSTTDIPNHLGLINAAFQRLCGGYLSNIICPWAIWNNVIQNDVVAAIHGSSAPPFTVLERGPLDEMVGNTQLNVLRAQLTVLPGVTWWITNEGFDLGIEGSEAFTQMVPDTGAVFVGHNPTADTVGCYIGSEPIAEYDGGPEEVKRGLASWAVKRANPTGTDLFVLDNALVVNHVPASVAFGTVVF